MSYRNEIVFLKDTKMSDIKKDNNGLQIKKTESDLESIFNDFLKNQHHSFIVLKTEKLASAVYMVTGFVSDSDPLKSRLRTSALDLVSCVACSVGQSGEPEVFASRCLEIGTMLSVAERAGLVSPMNARVLCGEYASLAQFLRDHRDKVFGSAHVDVAQRIPPQNGAHERAEPKKDIPNGRIIKRTNTKRHINRRSIILSLFDKKDRINIKDATSAVEGCSEKTIQRELLTLVEEGVLLRQGQRRWSTYTKSPSKN